MRPIFVSAALLVLASGNHAAIAGAWSPSDPNSEITSTRFTIKWAKSLRGFHTLADVQRAAGSGGKISERNLHDPDPTVSYHWRSEPPNSVDVGYMLVTVRQNGRIAVNILTGDNVEIILNNGGAFICEKCVPPIDME